MSRARRPGGSLSAADVYRLLEKRYTAEGGWALLPQVREATGFSVVRTADALAMGTWPSNGLHLHGFEIKVYRSDWLRELREPEKTEAMAARCHRWWIVAGDPSVVEEHEVPEAWGLLVAQGGGLRTAREAPLLSPPLVEWDFLAAILRQAHRGWEKRIKGFTDKADLADQLAQAQGRISELETRASHEDFLTREVKRLEAKWAAFEAATGIDMDRSWPTRHAEPEKLARAFKLALQLQSGELEREYQRRADYLDDLAKQLRREAKGNAA